MSEKQIRIEKMLATDDEWLRKKSAEARLGITGDGSPRKRFELYLVEIEGRVRDIGGKDVDS